MRPSCLRFALGLLLVLAAGCATLPERSRHTIEYARQDVAETPLARIAADATPADQPTLSGFRLLPGGESAFNARIALARRATRSLDVQYYLVADDETGRGFLRELRDAAQRGVRVRLLVDDLHAGRADRLLKGLAAYPNVQVRLFNPLPVRGESTVMRLLFSLHEFKRVNHRMHNKLFVADNTFAIVGGRNVADEYFMNSPEGNFLDMDVLAIGPVVRELSAVFDSYWNSRRAYAIEELLAGLPAQGARDHFDAAVQAASGRLGEHQRDMAGNSSLLRQLDRGTLTLVHAPARVLADSPDKAAAGQAAPAGTVAQQTLTLLASARDEVRIVSPYFIPGARGLEIVRALGSSEPNTRMTLLTNSLGSTDEPLAYAAYASYRRDLLKAGVRIHELSPTLSRDSTGLSYLQPAVGRLHTKMLTVDRRWLFIGSMNLDPRSANVNTETGIVIDSPELARQVNRVLAHGIASGAYRLRLGSDADRIEWVETDWQGNERTHATEPHDRAWRRLRIWLLRPFVSEDLL
ncbi:MAG TPA: phospholipase D family protein [Albitalea sp.]|nr:phospholipase D family protein [Albitalea sp.]